MKRSVLFAALLLSLAPAHAAPKNYGVVATREGKLYFDCQVSHIYPDGVTFTHRDGVTKIPFSNLPENLRTEFRYDPKAEAEYQKQQAAQRKAEQERAKQQQIALQEQLMEAQMAEASYLASASRLTQPTAATNAQTPSWVGTPITGPAVGGRAYSGSGYSGYPRFGYPYGGYYGGGYYPGYYSSGISYGYPYGGYSGYGYGYGSYYSSPSVFGSWNVGHGIHLGVGLGSFGFGHHHH